MNLVEISNHADKIKQEQREAILSLINLKTDNDMEKVLNAITHLENKVDNRIEAIEKVVDNKINTLYWVLGVIGAFITIVVSIVMAIVSR